MLGLIANNLVRRPGRTLLTALGIGVGVATIVALLAVTQGLKNTASGLVHLGYADMGIFQSGVADPTTSILPESMVTRLAQRPDVVQATPLLLIVEGVKQDPSAIVFGATMSGFFARRLVVSDGSPAGAGQIAVGDRLARELHLRPGGVLAVQGHRYPVAGIFHSGIFFEDSGAILPISDARALTGRLNEETAVVINLAAGAHADAVKRSIERDIPGTQAIFDADEAARAGANNVLISKAIFVIVVVALIVGGISVTNTMGMAIIERQGELALLSTVGWSPWRIASLILGEGVAVSLLGAGIGLLLGVIGSKALVHVLGVNGLVSPAVTASGLGRGLLVGMAIGVFGGLYPAWHVTRMRPLKALSRA